MNVYKTYYVYSIIYVSNLWCWTNLIKQKHAQGQQWIHYNKITDVVFGSLMLTLNEFNGCSIISTVNFELVFVYCTLTINFSEVGPRQIFLYIIVTAVRLKNLLDMSWKLLDMLTRKLDGTSWRHLEEVLKTSWKLLGGVLKTHLQEIWNMSWEHLEDVFKT